MADEEARIAVEVKICFEGDAADKFGAGRLRTKVLGVIGAAVAFKVECDAASGQSIFHSRAYKRRRASYGKEMKVYNKKQAMDGGKILYWLRNWAKPTTGTCTFQGDVMPAQHCGLSFVYPVAIEVW